MSHVCRWAIEQGAELGARPISAARGFPKQVGVAVSEIERDRLQMDARNDYCTVSALARGRIVASFDALDRGEIERPRDLRRFDRSKIGAAFHLGNGFPSV